MLFENRQFGNYKLLRQVGSGGMGEVYLAEDMRIARQVAIKIVRNEGSPYTNSIISEEAMRLFRREMNAISKLDHPHILSLYDFGEETINGMPISYMVMPFRSEGSLDDWLSKRENNHLLSLEDVAFIVSQAADALQEAHNQQLIHQDIKPSNFLIHDMRDNPNRPHVFLSDFGISKITSSATTSQTVRGTPAYMPPEQWEGRPVPATDQYALAVMVYQILTGYLPFQGNAMQIMRQQFDTLPKPPSLFKPVLHNTLDIALDAIILHALAKNPEERFPSVIEFAQAFQQIVHEQSLQSSSSFTHLLVPWSSSFLELMIQSQPQEKVFRYDESQANDLYSIMATPASLEQASSISPVSPPTVGREHTERKRTAGKRGMLLVTLAIVLILASIVGLGSYQIHVNTINVQATAEAVHVQPFQQATATFVAANPYPFYLPGKGTAVISDALTDHNNWNEYTDALYGGACTFKNDALHVTLTPAYKVFTSCRAQYSRESATLMRPKNFAFEVQENILTGNCAGIGFRGSLNNLNRLYIFSICRDGNYNLNYWVDANFDNTRAVVPTTPSSAIHGGLNQSNTIAVVANGSTITLYANQQLLTSVTDTSSTAEGWLALIADENDTACDITYRNAKLWQL